MPLSARGTKFFKVLFFYFRNGEGVLHHGALSFLQASSLLLHLTVMTAHEFIGALALWLLVAERFFFPEVFLQVVSDRIQAGLFLGYPGSDPVHSSSGVGRLVYSFSLPRDPLVF